MILPQHVPTRFDYGRRYNFYHANDIAKQLHGLPDTFKQELCNKFDRVYKQAPFVGRYRTARTDLSSRVNRLKKISFNLAADDDAIVTKAKEKSRECARFTDYKRRENFVKAHDITPPRNKPGIYSKANYLRMACEDWWRKKLRLKHRQGLEASAIQLGMVNAHREIYCSDNTVFARRTQKKRNQKILEKVEALNSDGFQTTLADLCSRGVSNPANRRVELMVRCRGYDDYAEKHGHISMFYTITCPSRMHSTYAKSGQPIPAYDDTLPNESRQYLATLWKRARAELARHGIRVYGVRVAEAHHDGTPHWHLLFFMLPWQKRRVTQVLEHYAKAEDKHDLSTPDAHKARFLAKQLGGVDPVTGKKQSATGYIAKYISKNIDGYQLDFDEYGNDAVESSERVEAWATTWKIRQFQFQGGIPVTLWRELRKLDRLPQGSPDVLVKAWECADTADWCGFIEAMGGVFVKKNDLPIQLKKSTIGVRANKYGEVIPKYMALAVALPGGGEFIFPLKSMTTQWTFNFKGGNDNGNSKRIDARDTGLIGRGGINTRSDSLDSRHRGRNARTSIMSGCISHRYTGGRRFISNRGRRNLVHVNLDGTPLSVAQELLIKEPIHAAHVSAFFSHRVSDVTWSSVNNCTDVIAGTQNNSKFLTTQEGINSG